MEVILALALSALVLVFVAGAIDVHLRLIDSNRTGVEEAQLARVLLGRIADDLRGTVLFAPPDIDKLASDVTSQAGAAAFADAMGSLTGSPEEELGTSEESSEGSSTADLAESIAPQSTPGLYGNQFQIQMDTSRLPRMDELSAMLSSDAAGTETVVSDSKTVAYYVISDVLGGMTSGSSISQSTSGLVRREYDRATTIWAAEQGLLADLEQDVEPIAPEVAIIEFRYFDGTTMVEEWDSEERGGLPVAVEIAIGITPARLRNKETESNSLTSNTLPSLTDTEDLLIFRRLVHLPVAQPTTEGGASSISGGSGEDPWGGFDEGTGAGSSGGGAAGSSGGDAAGGSMGGSAAGGSGR